MGVSERIGPCDVERKVTGGGKVRVPNDMAGSGRSAIRSEAGHELVEPVQLKPPVGRAALSDDDRQSCGKRVVHSELQLAVSNLRGVQPGVTGRVNDPGAPVCFEENV